MSMPNIPDVKPKIDIKIDDSINLLLESIAFEGFGLAHVINAEAEKIQYILGTLKQQKPEKAPTIDELLKVNDSVNKVLKDVIREEMLLELKLEDIIKLAETTTSSSTSTTTSTYTTTSTQSTTTTTTGNCNVTIKITVTTEGLNNNMNITGATAEIASNVVDYDKQ